MMTGGGHGNGFGHRSLRERQRLGQADRQSPHSSSRPEDRRVRDDGILVGRIGVSAPDHFAFNVMLVINVPLPRGGMCARGFDFG